MEIKEIMINNFFIGFDDKPFKWDEGDFACVHKGVNIDEIIKTPIELTEEILLKCGFYNNSISIKYDGIFCEQEPAKLHYDFDDPEISIKVEGNNYGYWINCKYLHQLQNLFYCMAGKELEIDLS